MVTEANVQKQIGVVFKYIDSDLTRAIKEFTALCELIDGLPDSSKKTEAVAKTKTFQDAIAQLRSSKFIAANVAETTMKNLVNNGSSEISKIFRE